MRIDHVVLAARTREQATRALGEVGLGVARGRAIPGAGVSNLVVPLGESLLEVHYPNGEQPDPSFPPIAEIQRTALSEHPDPLVPVAWLVRVDDAAHLRRLAEQNGVTVADVPSQGPGYPPYLLAGFGANIPRPWLPALIHWPVPPHERPSALHAPHSRRPTGITGVDVAGPISEIERWCGGLPNGVHPVDGDTGARRVAVGFTDGSTAHFGIAA